MISSKETTSHTSKMSFTNVGCSLYSINHPDRKQLIENCTQIGCNFVYWDHNFENVSCKRTLTFKQI